MNIPVQDIFKGRFLSDAKSLQEKLFRVKAFVFDWDGVFNNGEKDGTGGSLFNEVDAMGTNLLRFNHYLRNGAPPVSVIITGENNQPAFTFARREHFDAVYFKAANKERAFRHVCDAYHIQPSEVCFVFDDVLDFPVAAVAGLRILVSREANPLMLDFAVRRNWVDYMTFCDGNRHAVREAAELLIGVSGLYDETLQHRTGFSETYTKYLQARNQPETKFYTVQDGVVAERDITR